MRDYIDFDYLDKLAPEQRQYMARFVREHYDAQFRNDGTDLAAPHTAERKKCYDANNARNRDTYSQFDRVAGHNADRGLYEPDDIDVTTPKAPV